ncbi:hypothetical protein A3Q56_07096 [Intoshia linei]|uniref:Uncharacterized protein n=1 Tax=Intoshia linei TaxID=1819745 RepID=A0A177AUY1_9BILA|nr:hypothetical protein A3Q56_07096 [Intoshia linei]
MEKLEKIKNHWNNYDCLLNQTSILFEDISKLVDGKCLSDVEEEIIIELETGVEEINENINNLEFIEVQIEELGYKFLNIGKINLKEKLQKLQNIKLDLKQKLSKNEKDRQNLMEKEEELQNMNFELAKIENCNLNDPETLIEMNLTNLNKFKIKLLQFSKNWKISNKNCEKLSSLSSQIKKSESNVNKIIDEKMNYTNTINEMKQRINFLLNEISKKEQDYLTISKNDDFSCLDTESKSSFVQIKTSLKNQLQNHVKVNTIQNGDSLFMKKNSNIPIPIRLHRSKSINNNITNKLNQENCTMKNKVCGTVDTLKNKSNSFCRTIDIAKHLKHHYYHRDCMKEFDSNDLNLRKSSKQKPKSLKPFSFGLPQTNVYTPSWKSNANKSSVTESIFRSKSKTNFKSITKNTCIIKNEKLNLPAKDVDNAKNIQYTQNTDNTRDIQSIENIRSHDSEICDVSNESVKNENSVVSVKSIPVTYKSISNESNWTVSTPKNTNSYTKDSHSVSYPLVKSVSTGYEQKNFMSKNENLFIDTYNIQYKRENKIKVPNNCTDQPGNLNKNFSQLNDSIKTMEFFLKEKDSEKSDSFNYNQIFLESKNSPNISNSSVYGYSPKRNNLKEQYFHQDSYNNKKYMYDKNNKIKQVFNKIKSMEKTKDGKYVIKCNINHKNKNSNNIDNIEKRNNEQKVTFDSHSEKCESTEKIYYVNADIRDYSINPYECKSIDTFEQNSVIPEKSKYQNNVQDLSDTICKIDNILSQNRKNVNNLKKIDLNINANEFDLHKAYSINKSEENNHHEHIQEPNNYKINNRESKISKSPNQSIDKRTDKCMKITNQMKKFLLEKKKYETIKNSLSSINNYENNLTESLNDEVDKHAVDDSNESSFVNILKKICKHSTDNTQNTKEDSEDDEIYSDRNRSKNNDYTNINYSNYSKYSKKNYQPNNNIHFDKYQHIKANDSTHKLDNQYTKNETKKLKLNSSSIINRKLPDPEKINISNETHCTNNKNIINVKFKSNQKLHLNKENEPKSINQNIEINKKYQQYKENQINHENDIPPEKISNDINTFNKKNKYIIDFVETSLENTNYNVPIFDKIQPKPHHSHENKMNAPKKYQNCCKCNCRQCQNNSKMNYQIINDLNLIKTDLNELNRNFKCVDIFARTYQTSSNIDSIKNLDNYNENSKSYKIQQSLKIKDKNCSSQFKSNVNLNDSNNLSNLKNLHVHKPTIHCNKKLNDESVNSKLILMNDKCKKCDCCKNRKLYKNVKIFLKEFNGNIDKSCIAKIFKCLNINDNYNLNYFDRKVLNAIFETTKIKKKCLNIKKHLMHIV